LRAFDTTAETINRVSSLNVIQRMLLHDFLEVWKNGPLLRKDSNDVIWKRHLFIMP
jgi:hypothetical protein